MFLLSEWVKVGQSVWLFATSWTVQSLEFSRPEYWSVGSLSLLQGMFPTQGWNPGLPHCGLILYQLSYKGSPRILGSLSLLQRIFPTQESNQGLLHCRQFFTNWAIREAQNSGKCSKMSKNDVLRQILWVYHLLQIYGHLKRWKGEGTCLGGKREQRTSELLRLWNSVSESPGTSWTSKNRT